MAKKRSSEAGRESREAWVLYALVFTGGTVLMGAEIAGSRVLNPFFGSGLFVWGSLISVIMTALAAGYYIGGRVADRWPSLQVLCRVAGVAGVSLLVGAGGSVPVCSTIAASGAGPRAGPLLGTLVLFLIPGMLIATISPFAVRLSARDMAGLGNVAGKLYALSTTGSIVGTLLTTFVLIPVMGTRRLIFALGVVLALAAAAGLLVAGKPGSAKKYAAAAILAVLVLVGVPSGFAASGPGAELNPRPGQPEHTLVHWEDSPYHLILVTEQDHFAPESGRIRKRRVLRFNDRTQSAVYIDDLDEDKRPKQYESAVGYTDLLHLGLVFSPQAKSALFVGGGGGIGPTQFVQDYGMNAEEAEKFILDHELDVTVDGFFRKLGTKGVDGLRADLGLDMTVDQLVEKLGMVAEIAEIDAAVERISRERFFVDDRVRFHIGDGRRTLNRLEGGYDLIVLDAYSSGGHIPAHLTTREFLSICREKLAPGGAVVSNVISALEREKSKFYQSEVLTMRAAGFEHVYTFPRFPTPAEQRHRGTSKELYFRRDMNIILVASQEELTAREIIARARRLTEREERPVRIKTFIHYAEGVLVERPEDLTYGMVLTDDYCPVDTMFHDQ